MTVDEKLLAALLNDPLYARLYVALRLHGEARLEVNLRLADWLQVCRLLQLALRHPDLERSDRPAAELARELVAGLAERLTAVDPALGDAVQRGWTS